MFRNLTMFRFPAEAAKTFERLPAALFAHPLRQCSAAQMRTRGWVSPYGQADDALVLAQGHFRLITLGGWDKSIPASAVEAELAERVKVFEAARSAPLRKSERRKIKRLIVDEMCARAIAKPMRLHGMIDLRDGWIVVDTASAKAAEDFISHLRLALGRLPAFVVEPETNPVDVLTNWLLSGNGDHPWLIGDECELRDFVADGTSKFTKYDLTDDEWRGQIANQRCTKLRVHFADRCSMVIRGDLRVSKFQMSNIALKDLHRGEEESPRDIVESAAALLFGEITQVLAALERSFAIPRPQQLAIDIDPEHGAE